MMNKLYGFLKECSDEESKKGKAIDCASRSVANLGLLMMGFGFIGWLYVNHLGLSDEVLRQMTCVIKSGGIVIYIALSFPWILGHKNTPFRVLGRYLHGEFK